MPPGMMSPDAWEKQKHIAKERLPPQFAELVCKTQQPFVQAVTDCLSPDNEYLEGKVLLVGYARYIQKRGVVMGVRSQFQELPLEEHIHDRNIASTPREEEVYPEWAVQI
ncbi:unnamed protein product [Discula destructiva]